jgi:hypothetical protein
MDKLSQVNALMNLTADGHFLSSSVDGIDNSGSPIITLLDVLE